MSFGMPNIPEFNAPEIEPKATHKDIENLNERLDNIERLLHEILENVKK